MKKWILMLLVTVLFLTLGLTAVASANCVQGGKVLYVYTSQDSYGYPYAYIYVGYGAYGISTVYSYYTRNLGVMAAAASAQAGNVWVITNGDQGSCPTSGTFRWAGTIVTIANLKNY